MTIIVLVFSISANYNRLGLNRWFERGFVMQGFYIQCCCFSSKALDRSCERIWVCLPAYFEVNTFLFFIKSTPSYEHFLICLYFVLIVDPTLEILTHKTCQKRFRCTAHVEYCWISDGFLAQNKQMILSRLFAKTRGLSS